MVRASTTAARPDRPRRFLAGAAVVGVAAVAVAGFIGAGLVGADGRDVRCEPPGDQLPAHRAAGCLAVSNGALLMVQTHDGWCIPGGFARDGETSAETAVRETREEAGVDVEVGAPRCAAPETAFVAHRCTVPEPRPAGRPDGVETRAVEWMDRARLEGLGDGELRFPSQRGAYLDALTGD